MPLFPLLFLSNRVVSHHLSSRDTLDMILAYQGGKGAVLAEECYLYFPIEASEIFAIPKKDPESKNRLTNKK